MTASSLQVFGRRKCRVTQKAERFFRDRGIAYQFIDLNLKPMSAGELASVLRKLPAHSLIDSRSARYKQRGMAWLEYDPVEELRADPGLMCTPIVRRGPDATVGDDPDGWRRLAAGG